MTACGWEIVYWLSVCAKEAADGLLGVSEGADISIDDACGIVEMTEWAAAKNQLVIRKK